MGWYQRVIFNRLLEITRNSSAMADERKKTLAEVTGRVLEIGIGTGLNLANYPKHIKEITNISPEKELPEIVNHRAEQNKIIINHHQGDAARLPFADNSFDSVVSTLTLCTVNDMPGSLRETYRVLIPGGKLFFYEHVLGKSHFTRTIQHLLNPLQQIVACGCSLCRDTAPAMEQTGFTFEELHDYSHKITAWPSNRIIRGIAVKPLNYTHYTYFLRIPRLFQNTTIHSHNLRTKIKPHDLALEVVGFAQPQNNQFHNRHA